MNRSLATLLALLFASIAVSSACFAGPNVQVTRFVTYGDLDLSKTNDVKALHRRIDHAVNEVCLDTTGPIWPAIVDLTCKSEAWVSARAQVKDAIARHRARKSAREVAAAIQVTRAALRPFSNR
jgi:UrcA family protein